MGGEGLETDCVSPEKSSDPAHSEAHLVTECVTSAVSEPLAAFVAVLTPEQRAVLAKLLAGAT